MRCGRIWQAGSVRTPPRVTMAWIMSCVAIWHVASPGGGPSASAEIIPCCNARTAERAPLQSPLRKRTTARNWPIAHHLRVVDARRLRNERYRSMTRARLLRDDCVMNERKRPECVRKKYPKSRRIPSRIVAITPLRDVVLNPVSGRLSNAGSVYAAACRNNFSERPSRTKKARPQRRFAIARPHRRCRWRKTCQPS